MSVLTNQKAYYTMKSWLNPNTLPEQALNFFISADKYIKVLEEELARANNIILSNSIATFEKENKDNETGTDSSKL